MFNGLLTLVVFSPAITAVIILIARYIDNSERTIRLIAYIGSVFTFILSLVIMIAVPLATVGGFIGLKILNLFTYQALDMLTLLGFLILIGIVVNNSILLVLKTVDLIKEKKMSKIDAIFESAKTRVRPIFMSTLTSIFGMFPLVLFPGAGSELYKGLGSVVIGGLFLSAILILVIVPALLTLTINENKIIKDSYK